MSKNYSLIGPNSTLAVERGLAEADWYSSPVQRESLRNLLERRDWPAIRDSLIWFGLLALSGGLGWYFWGTWWAVLPFIAYGALYASTSDARWHESSHGTAFKTDWMNQALYEIASFMVQRNSVCWRWSHNRHHSDTMIVGRDPEIQVPRPTPWWVILGKFLALKSMYRFFKLMLLHSSGRMSPDEMMYIPASEFPKVYLRARIYLAIYLSVIAIAITSGSILPLMYIGLPTLYGSWLMPIYGLTQHAGLQEDVLDHRLNSRTVYMDPINRFLYLNMNYHVEHHMYPMVPYHALPRLHALVKDDMPKPYPGFIAAFREIIPALLRQQHEPLWAITRQLPPPKPCAPVEAPHFSSAPDGEGWVRVGLASALPIGQVMRFDHGRQTFALHHAQDGSWHATDGICTHGNTHLGEGMLLGDQIECPKHNGRFRIRDGSASRPPACRALRTYPVQDRQGDLWLHPGRAGGVGIRPPKTMRLRVQSNLNLATFIKELVLEPLDDRVEFTPGDYLQLDIPRFDTLSFNDIAIDPSFTGAWEKLRHLQVSNPASDRRNNYSIASVPGDGKVLRFNVRIAVPPAGKDVPPGIGSSWVFRLKPGDIVTAIGPYGDFHVKPTQREMIYIGGGAGMAPIRAHLGALLDGGQASARRISYWYGARSSRELFYQDYFTGLAQQHSNFRFHVALSEPQEADQWTGERGFIHEVVRRAYLANHPNLSGVEFYLCGPPPMVNACTAMLQELGVPPGHIAFDAF